MAFLSESELEVGKFLVWNTDIPFQDQVRQSPRFSLMGWEWCFRFRLKDIDAHDVDLGFGIKAKQLQILYHVLTLHRVIDGQIANVNNTLSKPPLDRIFSVKTFLMGPTSNGKEEINAQESRVVGTVQNIWSAGKHNDDIFKTLPCLYNCSKLKFVCKFYGQPLSTFQLSIRTDTRKRKWQDRNGFANKSIQVSSEVPQNAQSLCSDFCHLLENETLSDVKLECGDHTFQAHRVVLAARSKVFHAMFHNKMLESQTGVVKISDVDSQVLKVLLEFIYSGKLDDLTEDNTAALYEVADKYGVISLRQACAYWIARNLAVENCIQYLEIADSHSDCDLKNAVVSFIVENPALLKGAEWSALSKKSPVLAVEVLQTYIASTVQ